MSAPDSRFADLRAALDAFRHAPDTPEPAQRGQAAVALVLRSRIELELLLIRRSEAEGDPWSGHMALPGGRRDRSDTSLLHTAVRETHEETGVVLSTDGQHLGRLSRLDPASRRLPDLSVTPFVFGVPGHVEAHVASAEVDQVFWVPVSTLRDPATAGRYRFRSGSLTRIFPSFNVEGQVVWGLTYRVLEEFLVSLG